MIFNFIINFFYYAGLFIREHTLLCVALFFSAAIAIIWIAYGPKSSKKLSAAERQLMLEAAKQRAKKTNTETKFECPNCGASLKAAYAQCEYCGARSRIEGENIIPY